MPDFLQKIRGEGVQSGSVDELDRAEQRVAGIDFEKGDGVPVNGIFLKLGVGAEVDESVEFVAADEFFLVSAFFIGEILDAGFRLTPLSSKPWLIS